jgi:hypothetical protein
MCLRAFKPDKLAASLPYLQCFLSNHVEKYTIKKRVQHDQSKTFQSETSTLVGRAFSTGDAARLGLPAAIGTGSITAFIPANSWSVNGCRAVWGLGSA